MAGQERTGVLSILTCADLPQFPSVFLLRGQFCNTLLGLQALINNSAPPCRSDAGVQIRALLPWNQPIFLISSSAEWKGAGRLKEAESVGVKSHLHSTGKTEKGRTCWLPREPAGRSALERHRQGSAQRAWPRGSWQVWCDRGMDDTDGSALCAPYRE